jgi:hypothetical protein
MLSSISIAPAFDAPPSAKTKAVRLGVSAPLAFAGLGLFVFAIVALSGPGRIDIVDGLTRYEVARSLVEHGDSVVRDDRITFLVFSGREGRRYTNYRFPHSGLGAAAIAISDLTGTAGEPRRHFFFSLIGAAACAALAVVFAIWFRHQGHSTGRAMLWAAAGVFCSPAWFYGTTTFDESLGAVSVATALVVAILSRRNRSHVGAAAAGLLLGLAVQCKPPLGIFILPALAGNADEFKPLREQRARFAWMLAGLAVGVAAYFGYDLYKFPPGDSNVAAEYAARYAPFWPGRPLFGFLGLTISPGIGAIWFWPPVAAALCGMRVRFRNEPWLAPWFVAAAAIYVVFVATLTFYSGEPSWGPRYLTPLFAAMWLFAPDASAVLSRRAIAALLAAGLFVQLLGLSVETNRLYCQRQWPTSKFLADPLFYFRPSDSKLINRPWEIYQILSGGSRATNYTYAAEPTFPVHVPHEPMDDIRRYHVLNSLRPWWINQRFLDPAERPVDIAKTAALLLGFAGIGLAAMALGSCREQESD